MWPDPDVRSSGMTGTSYQKQFAQPCQSVCCSCQMKRTHSFKRQVRNMQLSVSQTHTLPYLTRLFPTSATFPDPSSSAASFSLRLHRNWFRSPFSMYSVIMHSGSVSTHTARRRTMLGSLRRDMIRISFRKSFLQHGQRGYQFNARSDD